MIEPEEHYLSERVGRLEDEATIRRLVLSYGPAADAGLTSLAAAVWFDDGIYDWDADGTPHASSAAVEEMLRGEGHQGLIARGVAHFGGPVVVDVQGDKAIAVNYSLAVLSGLSRRGATKALQADGFRGAGVYCLCGRGDGCSAVMAIVTRSMAGKGLEGL